MKQQNKITVSSSKHILVCGLQLLLCKPTSLLQSTKNHAQHCHDTPL